MPDPWFNPILYSWIPGTVYGTLVGVTGGLAGTCAQKGKAKNLIMGLVYFFLITAIIFLITGVAAYLMEQPYGIWYGFLLPGIIGVAVIPAMLITVRKQYQIVENRKLEAQDL